MFKIGDKVTTKNYGVCVIETIEERVFGTEKKQYFVLGSLYENLFLSNVKIYILIDKAEEQMRHVLSKADVLSLIETFNDIEPIVISEFRARRNVFEELYKTGDIEKHCQLIKSLYLMDYELRSKKKTLSIKDKEYFEKIKKFVYDEFANALEISPQEVESFVNEKMDN